MTHVPTHFFGTLLDSYWFQYRLFFFDRSLFIILYCRSCFVFFVSLQDIIYFLDVYLFCSIVSFLMVLEAIFPFCSLFLASNINVTCGYFYTWVGRRLFFVLYLCLGFATCHGYPYQFCIFSSYALYFKCGKVIYSFYRGLCGKIARVVSCQSRMKCQPAKGPLSRLAAHLFRVLGNR